MMVANFSLADPAIRLCPCADESLLAFRLSVDLDQHLLALARRETGKQVASDDPIDNVSVNEIAEPDSARERLAFLDSAANPAGDQPIDGFAASYRNFRHCCEQSEATPCFRQKGRKQPAGHGRLRRARDQVGRSVPPTLPAGV